MTPQQFINKWNQVTLTERSACQQHFLDLCELLGQPKPAEADPDGAWYTFERGVSKSGGGQGWADVWMKNHFGWEYKGKHKDLDKAYDQLLRYREDLENPPLLVVCDMDRFEVHTNFTGSIKKVHAFDLNGLADPVHLDILRKLFTDPQSLKPGETTAGITEKAAKQLGVLADGMRVRGIDPHRAAHFLMKLMFCMFAEDIGLLGKKEDKLFTRVLAGAKQDGAKLSNVLKSLFTAMSTGGMFGADEIAYFNGGLFADADVVELTGQELRTLIQINEFDWENVEPSIFGTLFERTLDPAKRSQIGAHYTSRADIETLLEPVMMAPLRREWAEVRSQCDGLFEKIKEESAKARKAGKVTIATRQKSRESATSRKLTKLVQDFLERLSDVKVLDPACGSGNFLYVSLHLLLDLEKEVLSYIGPLGLGLFPQVRPTQLYGIEINPYAQQLAQVVIWIGFLQWMHHNGFTPPRNPVLDPIDTIENKDAILDLSDPENPQEPVWPATEFIVGNPPFLGGKQMKSELGENYSEHLRNLYVNRVTGMSDLCCYFYEKGREMVASRKTQRAALLATTGIKQTGSRHVLERINETCSIFWAISDRDWILDGASVRICIAAWTHQDEKIEPVLDGIQVSLIHANLSAGTDATKAKRLLSNVGQCFMGTTKVGDFDISSDRAISFLQLPNPSSQPNSDVLRPYRNGSDIVRTSSDRWIVDFGVGTDINNSSKYESPFEYLADAVKPFREMNNDKWRRTNWWLLGRTLKDFRESTKLLVRYIATPRVAKHRIFVWFDTVVFPDSKVIAISHCDDVSFGVLQSRIHEIWTLGTCGWHGIGNDATYNPTLCFETFPFPEPTEAQREAIAAAAKELDTLRNNWLNPPEWTTIQVLEFPGTVGGPWDRYIDPATVSLSRTLQGSGTIPTGQFPRDNSHGTIPTGQFPRDNSHGTIPIGTVKYPRIVPNSEEAAKKLKKRTLTNLYNERPTWLDLVHKKLDAAVFDAYGWNPELSNDELLARLLDLNLQRAKEE